MALSILDISNNGIVEYLPFCVWLLSLSIMSSRSIWVVACVSTPLPFMAERYCTVWIFHNLSVHPLIDIWAFIFYILAIVTSAAMNIRVQVFEQLFSILWCICLGVEFLGHMVILCLTFWRTIKMSPKQLNHFTFQLAIYRDSSFYTSFSTPVIFHSLMAILVGEII